MSKIAVTLAQMKAVVPAVPGGAMFFKSLAVRTDVIALPSEARPWAAPVRLMGLGAELALLRETPSLPERTMNKLVIQIWVFCGHCLRNE